jgi:flagellar motor switch protein FliN
MTTNNDISADDVGDDWAAALAEQATTEAEAAAQAAAPTVPTERRAADRPWSNNAPDPADVRVVAAESFAPEQVAASDRVNLEAIMDIPVTLSVVIGSTKINIRNLLQLNQGSVVELDRLAGEPLDVLVNGTLIAHGEIVVVNEKFGIRLTDVVSAQERIRKLR